MTGRVALHTGRCHASIIVVPFAVDPGESTPFTRGSHRSRLKTYYRSAIATFGTLRRFNPGLEYVFATNIQVPQWVARQFQHLEVQVRHVAAVTPGQLPPGTTFRTSLYLFDVLRATAIPHDKAVVFLDPDVVCVRPFRILLEDGQVGCLALATGAHDSIKGITLADIAGMRASQGGHRDSLPRHIGGEVLVVTPAALPTLLERIDEGLKFIGNGHSPGLLNEEHVLIHASDPNWCSLRSCMARIWTSPRYRDIPGDALDLSLWHLPAEKTRGLGRVYHAVRRRSFDRMTDGEMRRLLGRWTGVVPTCRRALSDFLRRGAIRLDAAVRGILDAGKSAG